MNIDMKYVLFSLFFLSASFMAQPHTSLEYCDSTKFRNTGPTEVDVAAANQKQIPGFLYDYEAPVIHGGDSKNAPKKLYTYGQYSQRPPMN